ncbi:MAG: SRPBCC family protein [Bdellovibrionaceae bacterium]|nr:SRPBCC family protein [Pseudobdellovibrionaceae bacterium]NUM57849.1 SRPBCC family protein [Pseudobdellovibrionaceae bacterium]
MFKKFALATVIGLVLFLGYVSTKPSKFHYEKSVLINATADKIFPYLSNFKMGKEWNPFDQRDPNITRKFLGFDAQVGSVMEFEGNSDAGSGRLEILKIVSNELVEIRLIMTKPMAADNLIQYKLRTNGTGTEFTWSMSGDGGFVGKLFCTFIDVEKMMLDQFEIGFTNLKKIVESK